MNNRTKITASYDPMCSAGYLLQPSVGRRRPTTRREPPSSWKWRRRRRCDCCDHTKAERGPKGPSEGAEKECDSAVPGGREACRKMHSSKSKAVYPLLIVLMCLTSPSSSSVDTGYNKATVRIKMCPFKCCVAHGNYLVKADIVLFFAAIFYTISEKKSFTNPLGKKN